MCFLEPFRKVDVLNSLNADGHIMGIERIKVLVTNKK